jgi:hypothetical protein
MLYNQDQRKILEDGAAALRRAELQKIPESETKELYTQVFIRRDKDFSEIRRLTSELGEQFEEIRGKSGLSPFQPAA